MYQSELITVKPGLVSGTPVFTGTRVPIQTLFDYLSGDHPLDDFLDYFPTVQREQALGLLTMAKRLVFAALPVESDEDAT